MQLPINAMNTIELYERESGMHASESMIKLIEKSVALINSCFNHAKNGNHDIRPLDKNEFVQLAKKLFQDKGDVFTELHKEFFEESAEIAIEAYQQGLAEAQQKARVY